MYNVKGIIERIDLLKEGSNANGDWKLYAYWIKTSDKPTFLYVSIFNPDANIVVGNYVSVDFEVVGVNKNGRCFNSVNAKNVINLSPASTPSQGVPSNEVYVPHTPARVPVNTKDNIDDIPF